MTVNEAIENLKMILKESTEDEYSVCYVTGCNKEPLEMAIKAIKKQIPKKPEEIYKAVCCEDIEAYGEDALFGYCPECNILQCNVWNPEYCGDCGQKLHWTD